MMRFPKTRIPTLAMAGAICLLSTPMLWGGNGKGQRSGGGKNNPPLDVAYRLSWLGTLGGADSIARDINDWGVVVGDSQDDDGNRRAFRVVPVSDSEIDNGQLKYWLDVDNDGMNDLMEDLNVIDGAPTPWIDSEDPAVPATGWLAYYAHGINTWGEIVGLAWHPATDESRAFLFSDLPNPQFLLLPRMGPGRPRARAINDLGTIVGILWDPGVRTDAIVYTWNSSSGQYEGNHLLHPGTGNPIAVDLSGRGIDINNTGQIVIAGLDSSSGYSGWRGTANVAGGFDWESFEHLRPSAINQTGAFAGSVWPPKKPYDDDASFRYSDDNGLEIIKQGKSQDVAMGINSSGDVCLIGVYGGTNHRPYLYWEGDLSTREDNVLVPLDELVVGTNGDLALWNEPGPAVPWAINMRDNPTGFAQICGGAGEAFVLTPEVPQQ